MEPLNSNAATYATISPAIEEFRLSLNNDDDSYRIVEIGNINISEAVINSPAVVQTTHFNQYPQVINMDENIGGIEYDLTSLFKSWNMEQMVEKFKDEGVEIRHLKYMRHHHLAKFFYHDFGNQMEFEHHLVTWQKQNNWFVDNVSEIHPLNDAEGNCDHDHDHSILNKHTYENVYETVGSILSSTERGKCVKEFYAINKYINNTHRDVICTLLVEHFVLLKEQKPPAKTIQKLAEAIASFFPGENSATYFLRRGHKPPLGKLYNKFTYHNRKINKILTKKTNSSSMNESENINNSNVNINIDYGALKKELCYMRSPRETIIDKWQQTSNQRMIEILENQDPTVYKIFQDWPLYKHAFGPELLNIDFQSIYPDKFNIYAKWDDFVKKIPHIIETSIKHTADKKKFLGIMAKKDSISIDTYNIELLKMAITLIPPSPKSNKKNSHTRHTIRDSQNSFLITPENLMEMNKSIDELQKLHKDEKEKFQPILAAVGIESESPQFVTVFDGYKYKFSSFLEALDITFKLFQVFHLEYPKPSYNLWLFVQQYFYEICTRYDEKVPCVITLISDLKNRP